MGFIGQYRSLTVSTQFESHYRCRETGVRVDAVDALIFVCPATEGKQMNASCLCSLSREQLNKIPKNWRSKKEANRRNKNRINIYSSNARFEPAGHYSTVNRHLIDCAGAAGDVGNFLFSITKSTLKRHLPKCSRFLKSRIRRDYATCYESVCLKPHPEWLYTG